MSNNDWTNKLRDQLADYQEPVSRDLWAGIEQSLAQKTGHQEVSKPGKIIHINTWKRWSAAAAAVALLGIGGSYVWKINLPVRNWQWQQINHLHLRLQSIRILWVRHRKMEQEIRLIPEMTM